jgi:galactokinase
VAVALRNSGHVLRGANLLVHGEVPIGAGLSSSAAIEVASALALLSLNSHKLSLPEIAKLCQKAENEFVGAHVGIMDQLVPLPKNVKLVICNTMVKHELSSGEYNRRREECEQGVGILSKLMSGVRALRDVTPDQLSAFATAMPPVIYKRCRHVVEENQRVLQTAEFLRSGSLDAMGKVMRDSHCSLRDLYEVSCRELDVMVAAAEGLPGQYGSRMTGGGFGGCTINLVAAERAKKFRESVARRYREQTGISPEVYVCSASDGARVELESAAM